MNKESFSKIRLHLGKTQKEMAELLGISPKAIQSFEQGWRNIPMHAERQILFLLTLERVRNKKNKPCWTILKCPMETRQDCPAWEFRAGHLCWFISGTVCKGKVQKSWQEKMKLCQECKVFRSMIRL